MKYEVPKQYLDRAHACIGDWIIDYEPRKVVGTKGYHAIAKVERIIPNLTTPGMYLALIEPGSYLDLATSISFADANGPIERGAQRPGSQLRSSASSGSRAIGKRLQPHR